MDVGEPPPLPTRPGPDGERDRLALTLWGRLNEEETTQLRVRFSSAMMMAGDINFMHECVYDRMLFSIFIFAGECPYILVCTSCPSGWLNQEGLHFHTINSGTESTGEVLSVNVLDFLLSLVITLAFRYGWSQTALTGRQLWENQYDQVERVTNGNKWRALTAPRYIHAGEACHRSSHIYIFQP